MRSQNKNKISWAGSLCLALIFTFAISFSGCVRPLKPQPFPQDLTWPPPPDIPRVKFIAAVSSEEDVAGAKKRGLKDLILGRDPSREVRRLRKPYGVCTDADGRIYVADSGQGLVFVFDRRSAEVDFIGHRGQGRLAWPIDVAVDKDDNVFVSDVRHKNVFVYNPDGSFKFALGKKGAFVNPTGLGVDNRNGRILVADSRAHHIKVFTGEGQLVTTFGERGSEEGQLNFPTNVTVGRDGFIYVVDTGNHRVQVFDQNYEYYDDFGSLGTHPGQFRRPKGIALDSENHIYVVDSDFNNFQIFNQEYQILMPVGGFGRDFGQFWLPAGLHIDENDRIYVVDSQNKRVQIFQYLKQPDSN